MKDLTVFIIGDLEKRSLSHNGSLLHDSYTSVTNQLSSLDCDYEIINTEIKDIPNRVNSNLVLFLRSDHLIPDDYIFNACNINNLFRNFGILFGPVYTRSSSAAFSGAVKDHYHRYDFGIDEVLISNITNEQHNYGDMSAAIVSGPAYNQFNFSPVKTPRGYTINNHYFFNQVAKKHQVLYCSSLYKLKVLTDMDFDPEILSDYYYNKGYECGLHMATESEHEKKEKIWKNFVESPELTDYESPRWLHDTKETVDIEYLQSLLVLKFHYQLGLFEGMLGKKLV